MQLITGNLVDIFSKKIYVATITINNGKIDAIKKIADNADEQLLYILPGFIDSHVHIESSMLIPAEFARLAVVHGTVATVSDPHEIANVCGVDGVLYMINNGKKTPFKFNFGAPSCVPATNFETAGATIDSEAIGKLLEHEDIRYLAEMMNFPGVLNGDEEVLKKIAHAHRLKKPVDGHAPGLRGDAAKKYAEVLASPEIPGTDHECFTEEEALDKLKYGMKILIREGTAAKNFEALISLLKDYPEMIMFCSDDKHPDSLVEGHINDLCKRAIAKDIPLFNVLQAACVNPVLHYKLDVGLLREGDNADLILVKDLKNFEVVQTYINGMLVAENKETLIESVEENSVNNFSINAITAKELEFPINAIPAVDNKVYVIEALDHQLITNKLLLKGKQQDGEWISDTENDVLKMVVVNRYNKTPVAKTFIKNFGLKHGAIASSVAHDSHNIIAVGVDNESLLKAINLIIEYRGGVSCVSVLDNESAVLDLPVAGLMSTQDGYKVAEEYKKIDALAKALGSQLAAPFMTLSFMALLVIPHLKLSDKGLFDGDKFAFLPVK